MKKIALLLVFVMIAVMLPQIEIFAATSFIYVAPNGDDSAAGTLSAPLKTMDAARKKVQSLKSSGAVTVYFRGGEYPVTSTVNFRSADSGTADNPITYVCYGSENVVFTGCVTLPSDVISPVTENDTDAYGNKILDRVISDVAREKLVKIDLSGFPESLTDAGDRGWSMSGGAPTEVFVDNEIIQEARWPNDFDNKAMFRTQNGTSGKTFVYPDGEDRTNLWNTEAVIGGGLYTTGWFSSYWYCHTYKIGSLDTETKTAVLARSSPYSAFQSGRPAYFHNLIEEIDIPGEGYIDKNRKVAYLYPSTEITKDTKVRVSNLRRGMVSVSGASHIRFVGLDFKYTINTPVTVSSSSYITFDNCEFAHTSSQGLTLRGKNLTLKNSRVYDTAYGGVTTNGGSRGNLTPANNEIVNNIFHHNDRLNHCYQASVQVDYNSVGIKIYNNLIYNTHHEAIGISYQTNDIDVSYNEIHHAVKESGDMGAIYWGRDPSVLGINITNNFFHHNGNPYNDGFNQSIFGDDGNTGANIEGNVFYQGTLTAANGGTTGQSFPVKTNGGQYYNVHNNVFIDSPTAVNFQEWVGNGFSSPYQSKYITYNYGVEISDSGVSKGSDDQWNKIKNYCNNQTWIDHYKGTQWECFFNDFSSERYNKLKELANAGNRNNLIAYMKTIVPSRTNTFKNNVAVRISNTGFVNGSANAKIETNYFDNDQFASVGKPLFNDYEGLDFGITAEGLAAIRKHVPDFKDIEFDKMGIQGTAHGSAPVITNAKLVSANGKYNVSYDYYDADGDKEGATGFVWLVSDKKDGKYEAVTTMGDREGWFSDEQYGGKYVKVEITPYDNKTIYGDAVTTEPLLVVVDTADVDRSSLQAAIDNANSVLSDAVVGEEPGQYPQAAYDELAGAVEIAEGYYKSEILYNYQVRSQTTILNTAVTVFKARVIVPMEYKDINDMLKNQSGWHTIAGSAPVFKDGSMTIQPNSTVSYRAEQFRNSVFRFKVKYNRQDNIDVNVLYTMGSVYFRQKDPTKLIWGGGNTGYLFWIKNTQLEAQIWEANKPNTITEFRNDSIVELDKEYIFEVGAYDIGDGAVKWVLYIDGKLIHEQVYSNAYDNHYGESGYFCIAAGMPSVTVSPVDVSFVRFNANGGNGSPSDISVGTGKSVVIPQSIPNRDGYFMAGWSDSATGEVKYKPGDKITISTDIELFAVWEKLPVVSVKSCDGNSAVITSDSDYSCYVIFASFKNGKLYDVKIKKADLKSGDTTIESGGLKTDGATVKTIVIRRLSDLHPLLDI